MKQSLAVLLVLGVFVSCGGNTEPGSASGGTAGNGAAGGGTGGGGTGGVDAGKDYDLCTANADCVIRPASCCGQCGAATRTDIVALNASKLAAYQADTCGDDVGCPACYMEQDARLIATCNAGRCQVVDLSQHESTACTTPADCRIRTSACCECNGPTDVAHLIAVSSEPGFAALVCDAQGCDDCAPAYPPEVVAQCNGGHCEAVWPLQ